LLVLAVGTCGITEDLARLVSTSFYLQGVLNTPGLRRLSLVELSERESPSSSSSSSVDPANFEERRALHVRDVSALFAGLPIVATQEARDAISKAVADVCMFAVRPCALRTAASDVARQATNVSTLIYSVQNVVLMRCGDYLREFSESWVHRLNDCSRRPLPMATANPERADEDSSDWTKSPFGSLSSSADGGGAKSLNGDSSLLSANVPVAFTNKVDQLSESFRRHLHVTPRKDSSPRLSLKAAKEPPMAAEQIMPKLKERCQALRRGVFDIPTTISASWLASMAVAATPSATTHPIATFEEAVRECQRRAEAMWPEFRAAYLSTQDSCRLVLDPKFEGSCLGANLTALLCQPLIVFATNLWNTSVLRSLQRAEEGYAALAGEFFGACGRTMEQRPMGQYERLQFRQFLWQSQEAAERASANHFHQVRMRLSAQGMNNIEGIVSRICKNVITAIVLSKASQKVLTMHQYRQLVEKAFAVVPSKCVPVIQIHFSNVVNRAAAQHLEAIEQRFLFLINAVLSSPTEDSEMEGNSGESLVGFEVTIVTAEELLPSHRPSAVLELLSN
jgi:hypothetical protein